MKFMREIPVDKIDDAMVLGLEQFGFTLIYTADSIEVWADAKEGN